MGTAPRYAQDEPQRRRTWHRYVRREPQQDDRPVEHEGETLLYVSGCVAEAYAGFVVDVEEGPEGLRFGVGPPEAGHFARS
jgi:hypothetical protein